MIFCSKNTQHNDRSHDGTLKAMPETTIPLGSTPMLRNLNFSCSESPFSCSHNVQSGSIAEIFIRTPLEL